jgi:hypothetical protein
MTTVANPFEGIGPNLTGAVVDMLPIVPHDTNVFPDGIVSIGLYITTGGTVVFTTARGTLRTVTVPDNFYLICSAKRVTTDTTATGIFALVS